MIRTFIATLFAHLLLIASVLFSAFLAHADTSEVSTAPRIVEASPAEFRVVMEHSPPLQFVANNQIHGSVATKVKKVFERAGLSAKLEIFPWTRALAVAQSENNTFISNIARTPSREKLFKWVDVVYSYQFALVATNDVMSVNDLEEVKSYTIAVQRNDVAHEYLEKQGFSVNKNLFLTSDISESWKLLNLGNVDFVVEDMSIVDVMAQKHLSNGRKVSFVLPIQELTFDAWLAANPSVDDYVINKLVTYFD